MNLLDELPVYLTQANVKRVAELVGTLRMPTAPGESAAGRTP